MTVAQLIEMLNEDFMPSDEIIVTWEGTMHGLGVYPGAEGVVVFDADGDHYRDVLEGKVTEDDDSVEDVRRRSA